MDRRFLHRVLVGLAGSVALIGPAAAQDGAAPPTAEVAAPAAGFSSAAQARQYLRQNPEGPRAETAFRTIVTADLLARYPGFDPAQLAAGSALRMDPGATETQEQIEAILAATTPGIGTVQRTGFW